MGMFLGTTLNKPSKERTVFRFSMLVGMFSMMVSKFSSLVEMIKVPSRSALTLLAREVTLFTAYAVWLWMMFK